MKRLLHYRNRLAFCAGVLVPFGVASRPRALPRHVRQHRGRAGDGRRDRLRRGEWHPRRGRGRPVRRRRAWFDFFLTRPYDRFTISHRPDLETTIAIFVVGVLVTELAAGVAAIGRPPNSSIAYVEMIHAVAALAAEFGAGVDVIDRADHGSLVHAALIRACRFERRLSDPPLARIQSNGDVAHVGMRWPAARVRHTRSRDRDSWRIWRGRVVGRFRGHPDARRGTVSLEQRIVAVAVVDVVAAYLVGELHAT